MTAACITLSGRCGKFKNAENEPLNLFFDDLLLTVGGTLKISSEDGMQGLDVDGPRAGNVVGGLQILEHVGNLPGIEDVEVGRVQVDVGEVDFVELRQQSVDLVLLGGRRHRRRRRHHARQLRQRRVDAAHLFVRLKHPGLLLNILSPHEAFLKFVVDLSSTALYILEQL